MGNGYCRGIDAWIRGSGSPRVRCCALPSRHGRSLLPRGFRGEKGAVQIKIAKKE